MKKAIIATVMAVVALGGWAEIKTVVFTPEPVMTCQNCEKKIKSEIRFVKGTKSIETSLKDNTVTITYDDTKASVADYEKAFKKIGREVTEKCAAPADKKCSAPADKKCGNSCGGCKKGK